MKTLARWIRSATASLLTLLLSAQVAQAFPGFLSEPNDFLTEISSLLLLRVSVLKSSFAYELEDNLLTIETLGENTTCSTGQNVLQVEQLQDPNGFTDIIYIEECSRDIGSIRIERQGKTLTKANLNDLLHLRLPEITSESSYLISFPENTVSFDYRKSKTGKTRFTLRAGQITEAALILDYTETTLSDETLREYKTNYGTLFAKRTKQPDQYELLLYAYESSPMGIDEFHSSFESIQKGIVDLIDWKLPFFRPQNDSGGHTIIISR